MKVRILPFLLLIIYCAFLFKVMVLKDVPLIKIGTLMINFGGSQTGPANLIPFKTISVYLFGDKGLLIAGINLIGNILLLMPVGFIVPFVYRNVSWRVISVIAAGAGFLIEGIQVALRLGIFDIDDVILNGLGVLVGYWFICGLYRVFGSMSSRKIKLTVGLLSIFPVAALVFITYGYQHNEMPVSFHQAVLPQRDPCGGTGGTGEIIAVINNAIKIKASSGQTELIVLTTNTTIQDSRGKMPLSGLRIGNRVTIVTFVSDDKGHKIADAVFVCNAAKQ